MPTPVNSSTPPKKNVSIHSSSSRAAGAFATLGTRATLAVPLIKSGHLTSLFYLHDTAAKLYGDKK